VNALAALLLILHALVLINRGGAEIGVGSGVGVVASQNGEAKAIAITDQNSDAVFSLPVGDYDVDAHVPKDELFFSWRCQRSVTLDHSPQYLVISCQRIFFLFVPFMSGAPK